MKTKGMDWIEKWKGSPGSVNCPEAYIELPSDIWKCKVTRERCGIQAQFPIDDKKKFLSWCKASEECKENIFQTIISGKYTGFHHIPSRYLCIQCRSDKWKKRYEHYHYPWELASVSDCVDFSGEFKPEKSEIDDILDRYSVDLPKDIWLENLPPERTPRIVEAIKAMTWTFWVFDKYPAFLTCDNPFFYFTWMGVGKKDSEFSFPISSHILLWATWRADLPRDFIKASSQIVKEMNRRTVHNASRFIFHSRDENWIVPFIKKKSWKLNRIV